MTYPPTIQHREVEVTEPFGNYVYCTQWASGMAELQWVTYDGSDSPDVAPMPQALSA